MKFVVTGATGLVGGSVVKEIRDQYKDSEVLALGRQLSKLEEMKAIGSQVMQFDITAAPEQYDKLNEWGGSEAYWIHCAAAITGAPDDQLEEVNNLGTQKLVKKAEELNIARFILISSIAVFGLNSSKSGGFEESDSKAPRSKYGHSKLQQEKLLEQSQLEYVIFRPPFIGGPGDENVLPEFYKRIHRHKMPSFSKKGHFGYIDARDIAKVILQAIGKGTSRESFNIQGSPLELDQFVELLAQKTGIESPYGKTYPYIVAIAAGTLVDIIARLQKQSRDRSISRYRVKSLTSNRILNTSKAEKDLGFSPEYTVEQSIEDWFATYHSNSSAS